MARLHVIDRSEAQEVMDDLHKTLERRIDVSSHAPCPVEFMAGFVQMCSTQSCGKCTPCRVGTTVLHGLLEDVLENRATEHTLKDIERVAQTMYLSSDCAIGYETGAMALTAIRGFHDDFADHVHKHVCGFEQSKLVPCVSGCPAGVDVPGYIALVEANRHTDAVRLIRKDNPLPIVCGLICEHPCELYCRRGMVDDALNIRGLKRFATDNMESDYTPIKAPDTGKRVAIIGGGPSGLSAAYFLAIMGHKPTIFEQRKHLGGMLRYGIPSYRLPRKRLDEEIQWLLDCGIEAKTETPIGENFDKIRAEYDAVYLAIGAHADRKLGLPGENHKGVMSAVQMLRDVGDGILPDFTGKKVAVVGGGNVAMDVARTAVRCNAEHVVVVYRRRIEDMTAQEEEIVGAKAEEVEFVQLYAPQEILADDDDNVCGLKVQRQIIGGPKNGRPAPRNADEEPVVVHCNNVVVAIGQAVDSEVFEQFDIPTNRGKIVTNPDGSIEGLEGVFSGGDCQTGPATVIRAINAGKVAAANIDNYLGFDHKIKVDIELPQVQFKSKHLCARCEMPERRSDTRMKDFRLVERPLTAEEAHQEAGRCLRCDHFGFGGFRGGRVEQW